MPQTKQRAKEKHIDRQLSKLEAMIKRGEVQLDDGQYQDCEQTFKKALSIALETFGPKHLNTAIVLNKLGMSYKYLSRYKDAQKSYRQSLDIAKRLLRSNDPFIASLYHNLGGLEHSQGHFALAEFYARESVRRRKKIADRNHPDLAEDMAALAAILRERGKYGQAKKLFMEVLPVFRLHAATTPRYLYDIAINANNLAAIYADLGDLETAKQSYLEALEIKERILPKTHADIAITLNNLAMLHLKQSQFDEAQRLQRRCISILKESVGEEHPKYRAACANAERIKSRKAEASALPGPA
jgi:tetratricopeptide (TPR) repeat protein